MIVIGLKACDTCRKALKTLKSAGEDVSLRDVREAPLSQDEVRDFLERFGADLINTRSTTWRSLSEEERGESHETLLARYPALMKRPVIVSDAEVTLGWSDAVRAAHLGKDGGSA